ncbi:hypothetical protein G6F65_020413 [Rhizopus arrhizus]|nr:hypothetical protein G6F65_020413 [Rhizopus arrhizus]
MQNSPLFQTLFRHARRAFWVFQMQHALDDLPQQEDTTPAGFSRQDPLLTPIVWSQVLAKDAWALPLLDGQPGFTSAYAIGPVAIMAADLRTERSRTQPEIRQRGRTTQECLPASSVHVLGARRAPQTAPGRAADGQVRTRPRHGQQCRRPEGSLVPRRPRW